MPKVVGAASDFEFVCTPPMVCLMFKNTMLNGVTRGGWMFVPDEEFYVHAKELLGIWVETQMRKANGNSV